MVKASKPRRGRPKIAPSKRRNRNFTFRGRADLHDKLRRAALDSGRSHSQEVEFRLERSFAGQSAMIEVMEMTFGRDLAGLLLMLGHAMKDAGTHVAFSETFTIEGARAWLDNPAAVEQATKAAERIMQAVKPANTAKGKKKPGDRIGELIALVGVGFANTMIEEAATGEHLTSSQDGIERARLLHRLAGRIASRSKGKQS